MNENDRNISWHVNYFIFTPIVILLFAAPIYLLGFGYAIKVILPLFLIGLVAVLVPVLLRRRKFKNRFMIMEENFSGNLNAYIEMGYTAFNAHDFIKAEEIFKDIVKRHPNRPAGYCGLGILEFEKKNFEEAKGYLEKTLELDPKYEIAKEKLQSINKR